MNIDEMYSEQIQRMNSVIQSEATPSDYFQAGKGHIWMLMMADGLQCLMHFCLAPERSPEA